MYRLVSCGVYTVLSIFFIIIYTNCDVNGGMELGYVYAFEFNIYLARKEKENSLCYDMMQMENSSLRRYKAHINSRIRASILSEPSSYLLIFRDANTHSYHNIYIRSILLHYLQLILYKGEHLLMSYRHTHSHFLYVC